MPIEVEVRGPLSDEQYERLRQVLTEKGSPVRVKDRVTVAYGSTDEEALRTNEFDLRARITNGIPELVMKLGKCSGSDEREEISVLLQEGQFPNLLRALAALGHTSGIVARNHVEVFLYDEVEFSLSTSPGGHRYFEAEVLVQGGDETADAQKRIGRVCASLGLRPFSDEGFLRFLQVLNREANTTFEYEKDKGSFQ